MSNAADRDSDQFGINMSAGRDLSLAGPMPQPCSIRGERWVRRQSQQYNQVCSCVVSLHPRHSDKLKHGVPRGSSWLEQYRHVSSKLQRGRPNHHFRRMWVSSGSSARPRPGDGTVRNHA